MKPPLGIEPKYIFLEKFRQGTIIAKDVVEKRCIELGNVITRYTEMRLAINKEWIDEYNELVKFLSRHSFDEPIKYEPSEVVLYQNGDKFELGVVKHRANQPDEYFVWYHTGDTAACTHARNLHKITNLYAFDIKRLTVD